MNKIIIYLRKNKILCFILFLALVVRVVGVYPGYPHLHPDETVSYGVVFDMLTYGDLNPRRFDYPAGVGLIHYFVYTQFILPVILLKVFLLKPSLIFDFLEKGSYFFNEFQVEIFGNRQIDALYWSRYINAILGALSVLLTYLAGLKLFNKKVGLFAAFLLAFNYRHVLASHLGLSDAPNSFFSILAIYACALLFEKNTRKRYLIAAACVGFSFSIKYQIFSLLPFLLVHFLWFLKKREFKYLFCKNFLFSLIIIPLIFAVINPYFVLNLKTALPIVQYVGARYGAGVNKFNFYPLYYLFYWGIGPLPFIAIILGLLSGLIFYRLKTVLLLVYIVPFFYIFLYYMLGGGYVRNFTPAIPILMIFAGLFFSIIVPGVLKIIKNKTLAWLLILTFTFFVNLESIKNSFTLSINNLKPWNRDALQTWADNNLPKTARITNDNLSLINPGNNSVPWEINDESSVAELQEKGYNFAVGAIEWRQYLLYWWFHLDASELIKHRSLPYHVLDNSYDGIAVKELLQYEIYELYKPWQAIEFNYFVSKILPELKNTGRQIYSFEFNKDEEEWYGVDIYNNRVTKGLNWDKNEGYEKKGSLVYIGMLSNNQTGRYTSKLIPIKNGKVYTITGFLKTEKELNSKSRDGFIRLDFYKDNNLDKIKSGGIIKSVSARVYGTKSWVKKQTTMKAPAYARFMTVSFQKNYHPGKIWLDDVKIYETDKMPEKFSDIPIIKSTIPDNILYPNSIL